MREYRLDSDDHLASINLKRICEVVKPLPKQKSNKQICHPIEDELWKRVINDPTAGNESRTEHAIVPLAQFPIAFDYIRGIVRAVCHDNRNDVTPKRFKASAHSEAVAIWRGILDFTDLGIPLCKIRNN